MTVLFFIFFDEANPHRSVRFSSMALLVFLGKSLDAYCPQTILFFHMIFQQNCARSRTGHIMTFHTNLHLVRLILLEV